MLIADRLKAGTGTQKHSVEVTWCQIDLTAYDVRMEVNKQYIFTSCNWIGVEKGNRSERDL